MMQTVAISAVHALNMSNCVGIPAVNLHLDVMPCIYHRFFYYFTKSPIGSPCSVEMTSKSAVAPGSHGPWIMTNIMYYSQSRHRKQHGQIRVIPFNFTGSTWAANH